MYVLYGEVRRGQDFGKHKQFHSTTSFLSPFKGLIPILPTPLSLHFPAPYSFSLHLSLPFCWSEGGSLHRDIMTLPSQIQKQCLISYLLLSGLNYCRQAPSRQHQANITSNIFLFQIVGTETTFPQRFNMLLSLSPTLPVHIHYVSPHSLSLSLTLAVCTVGPNS